MARTSNVFDASEGVSLHMDPSVALLDRLVYCVSPQGLISSDIGGV